VEVAVAVAEMKAEVEAEAETVSNDGKQVVTEVNRQQQQQIDGDSSDSLEWRAGKCMSGYKRWWNEWQASLVDSWGSSGKTLGLRM
jgi:hypothetical protein